MFKVLTIIPKDFDKFNVFEEKMDVFLQNKEDIILKVIDDHSISKIKKYPVEKIQLSENISLYENYITALNKIDALVICFDGFSENEETIISLAKEKNIPIRYIYYKRKQAILTKYENIWDYTTHLDVIIHGCNTQKNFGAGFVKQVKQKYPNAYLADLNYDSPQLGEYSVGIEEKITFVNLYSQMWYGRPYGENTRNFCVKDTREARYNAIRTGLEKINLEFKGKIIGMPKIGAGLAGLNWAKVKKIIKSKLKDCIVIIFDYNPL